MGGWGPGDARHPHHVRHRPRSANSGGTASSGGRNHPAASARRHGPTLACQCAAPRLLPVKLHWGRGRGRSGGCRRGGFRKMPQGPLNGTSKLSIPRGHGNSNLRNAVRTALGHHRGSVGTALGQRWDSFGTASEGDSVRTESGQRWGSVGTDPGHRRDNVGTESGQRWDRFATESGERRDTGGTASRQGSDRVQTTSRQRPDNVQTTSRQC